MSTCKPTDTPVLPQKLKKISSKAQKLEDAHADRLIASKRSGEVVTRESLAALYALASRLHSPRLVFHAKSLETSQAKHITAEQVWGQMSVLLRPVLRRLQDNVRYAERLYGAASGQANKNSSAGKNLRQIPHSTDSDDEEKDEEAASTSSGASENESDLDEEITQLLEERKRRVASRKGKASGKGKDDWRFAFGKGGDDDEEDWDDEDAGKKRRNTSNSEDEADMDSGDGMHARRARGRNQRAMMEADVEDEDIHSSEAAEEELAALREMYGEDFEYDGERLAAIGEEDPDFEDDLMNDRSSQQGDGEENDEENLFDEQLDGARGHARGDMLNDVMGDFEENASQAGAESDIDEELQQALADPNLTALEKERLIEKKKVEKLEQQRLYATDWAMAGETAASKRPREALLEIQDLEFDYGMKALPVITAEFTAKLEDRIKRRVVEKHFDDVERRSTLTTADTLVTTRRDAVLDSEKSKLSLMDLYEKEYLDKVRAAEEAQGEAAIQAEPLTEIEKDELRAIQMWRRLAQHLDALSNFFYTPKPVQQDLEARVRAVERQAPAIALENVGNFAASREDALAPQDLYRGSRHKFTDVGANELKPSERRALRRAKKDQGKKVKDIKAKLQARNRPQSKKDTLNK